MYTNKIRGFVAMPIIIGSAILAVGVLGGLAYEYKNDKSILSSINKNNLLAQVYGGTTPSITVLSPNGGETFRLGDTMRINWIPQVPGVSAIQFISIDNTDNNYNNYYVYGAKVLGDPTNTNGYWDYQIPSASYLFSPGKYKIRIFDNNNVQDDSDNYFTIAAQAPIIKVLEPNGGENFKIGDIVPIQWSVQNSPTGYVAKIGLQSVQTGLFVDSPTQGYCDLAGGCVALTAGPIYYSIPASVAPGSYKIVIDCWKANSEVSDCSASDSSDAPFTISSAPAPIIKVLSPNGGETFLQGKTYPISWQTNDSSAPIGIFLSRFDEFGGTYNVAAILGKGSAEPYLINGENYYNWQVPVTTVIPGKYLIRVVAYPEDKSKTYEDSSDVPFIITAPKPTCIASTSCVPQYCQYAGDLQSCTVTNTDCSTSSYTKGSCATTPPQPTCTASTSCVPQYCQYGGDLKKCTVNKTDCSISSYTTGGCKSAPSTSTVCDSTAKAIVDSVGGCEKIDKSLYSNIYNVCCVSTIVTKESLLSLLNIALADGVISSTEKTNILTALNSYLQ